jgi:hypothetical protein
MNPRNDRVEPNAKPETPVQPKPKRFLIVRLEERIAPRGGDTARSSSNGSYVGSVAGSIAG